MCEHARVCSVYVRVCVYIIIVYFVYEGTVKCTSNTPLHQQILLGVTKSPSVLYGHYKPTNVATGYGCGTLCDRKDKMLYSCLSVVVMKSDISACL